MSYSSGTRVIAIHWTIFSTPVIIHCIMVLPTPRCNLYFHDIGPAQSSFVPTWQLGVNILICSEENSILSTAFLYREEKIYVGANDVKLQQSNSSRIIVIF